MEVPWKYHVFLSFRGEDTRNSFTGHLHAALERRGIITFIDDKLRKGEDISQELLQAIEGSLVSIVILSPDYASSCWCLAELQKILESKRSLGREVVPLFFNIDPSHVRHQRGTIGDAFESHRERFADDKVQGWRDALHEVANISGYDCNHRHEAKLIEEIVADVWAKLQPKLPYCFNNELVGIESRVEEVNSLLGIGLAGVRLIGIWGMPGIGKTTLARTIYERIFREFDICCFLANMKESSETNGFVALQRKLLSKLKIKGMEVDDTYEGKNIIRNMLCNKKVLVVLDDVSEINQLENLCIKQACLAPGSRVIVTTKNKHVLIEHGEFEIYVAELLNNDESVQLFCKKAFKRDEPIEGYWKLCKDIIHYAGGLPLTLEVLGSYFCRRSELEWKEGLEKIKMFPPTDILRRLRISYDALSETEKKIFLDVACCFKGMIKDQVTQIFEICGDLYPILGIRELVEKCLLTEYCCGHGAWRLGMHDILQKMGKSIVVEESPNDAGRRSRLWSLEDVDHVMSKNKGTDLVEIIHLQSHMPYEANWDPEVFSMTRSLTILIILCDVYLPGGLKFLPSSLKILEWKAYPLKSLPDGAHLDELVLLRMHHSKIIQLWGRTQMSKKLKFIDLSYSEEFIRTPDFSMLPNLEQLILKGCVRLSEVHPSLGQHTKVVVLDLNDCKNLKALPIRMEMDSLKKLILSGCLKVKKLPEFGENMTKLLVLDVKNCKNLVCLPGSTCNLKSLKVLNILGCSKFSSLPQNIEENKFLEELDLSGTAIREIPSSIVSLKNLKKLYSNGCNGLSSTSSSLIRSLLSPVRSALGFDIHEAPTALVLPPCISRLASLKELFLSRCNLKVESIPNDLGCLPSLEVLDLSGNDFSNLPDGSCVLPPSFSRLSSLNSLNLSYCNLRDGSIPENLSCLSSLTKLGLSRNKFTHLPAGCVANLSLLSHLHLSYCPKLKYLPALPPNLLTIDTVACHSMPPLTFSEFLSVLITTTNEFSKSFPSRILDNMDFKAWWIQKSDVPSWFNNQDFQFLLKVDGFQDNHVVQLSKIEFPCDEFDHCHSNVVGGFVPSDSIVSIKVDVSHLCGSSARWGISLCIVLQDLDVPLCAEDVFVRTLRLTYKFSQDEFFKKESSWRIVMGNNPNQMLMIYFPRSNFKVIDCGQIEFIFYTQKYKRIKKVQGFGKVGLQSQSTFVISKCGWRVISEEDVEEWRRSSMNVCSTSGNSEIPSQHSLYAYGKRTCEVEEIEEEEEEEEENIVTNEEAEIFSAKRRRMK
ncbi:TMV resistance protein N-like [Neltuma alba]|uniref:TMV resistance protein N-like n=1 Tax=Neltuma alba TaxID=207710 RepID=UPI0010A44CCD|nr:TMV resistance protein N-like [Prosopis alba]